MRAHRWKRGVCLLVVAWALVGCSDSSGGGVPRGVDTSDTQPGTTSAPVERPRVLETGKSDLALTEGSYRSPAGFAPALRITVSGPDWRSTHRGPDAFDLSRPDPTRDAPLVALVVMVPPESDAGAAFAALQARTTAAGATTQASTMRIGGVVAQVLDVRGGTGELVTSADGGIGLDTVAGGRSRVAVMDLHGKPVMAVIFVPDRARWQDGLATALPLLASVRTV